MTTLPVTCSMCGGQIEPDDVALRDELIVCPFCSTVNRITPTGTEKSAETVRQRRKPEGVKIERKGGDKYLFRIKGVAVSVPLIITRVFILVTAGLLTISLLVSPFMNLNSENKGVIFLGPLIFFWCVGFWFIFFLMMGIFKERFSYIPPIELTKDTLYASEFTNYWGKRPHIEIKDIRQIYTLAHKMPRIPRDSQMYRGIVRKNPEARSYLLQQFTSFSLFALTHDGKRVPLMSQIPNETSALYVEEALEVALGLFNLPVYGDQSLPRDLQTQVNLASTHSPELKVLNCKCCGAPLPATPNSARIGYLVCEHCHVLSLLYGAGTSKPILGLPQLNSPTSQFEITKVEKRLRIRSRETRDGTFLLLSKTDLEFRVSLSRSIETLNSAEIADIFAKEVDLMGPSFGIDLSNQSDWTEELAHSGDLEKSYQRIHGTLFYQLIAKTTAGKQICFLDKIKNPHEALALAERITYLYQPNTIVKG